MLITFKAKVKLYTEEDLEIEDMDLGNIVSKSPEWGWRDITIPEEEIYKLIAFTKSKTLVQMYDKELILANESHESLNSKWLEAKKSTKEPFTEPEYEDSNEENENLDEEDNG